MSVAVAPRRPALPRTDLRQAAPVATAALLAAAYVIVAPPSLDLAAHLFRARLGFALWDNLWYGGHATLGYSVLFPPVSALLTPQLAAALAATGTAAVFARLARRHFGEQAWLGALLFGAATAVDLYTGRLALAFGALPALAAVDALDRRRTALAAGLAALSALCSPVAALFAALAAVSRPRRGAVVAAAALAPVGLLAMLFPGGGVEPFALGTLVPVLAICAGTAAAARHGWLRTGALVYGAAALAVYLVPSPVGSNIARLGTLLAAPVAALLWWPRRPRLLAMLIVPLLYVGWQAPVRDVFTASGDPSVGAAYYRPLLRFLSAQPGGPFRIEIPFTRAHWESLYVASRFPLARGWERQLDIADNPLFYSGRLTAAAYRAWLERNAVRFVALPDVPVDDSARREAALIRGGLPYLRPVLRARHWRVYAVRDAVPLGSGAARVTALSTQSLTLRAAAPGRAIVRVRYTPYWALDGGPGCVAPAGPWTAVTLARPGTVRLVIRFALGRIGATSPRCTRG